MPKPTRFCLALAIISTLVALQTQQPCHSAQQSSVDVAKQQPFGGVDAASFEDVAAHRALLDEIAVSAEERETLLTSFSVFVEVEGGSSGQPPRSGSYHLVVDGDRLRCIADWAGVRSDVAIDRGITTFLTGSADRWTVGVVSRDRSRIPWGFDIRNVLSKAYNVPASKFCRDFATGVSVSGNVVTVESIREQDDKDFDFRIRVSFRRDLKYALARVEQSARNKGSSAWRPNALATADAFHQYADGGHCVPVSAHYAILPLVEYRATFAEWRIPPEIVSDTFVRTIPAGVTVDDQVRGVAYVATELGENKINNAIRSVPHTQPPRRSWYVFVLALNGVFLVAIACYWWFRRRTS